MINVSYVRMMARYNAWQNDQLAPVILDMPQEELTKDHGANSGGILGTANHLQCGDMLWLSRFDRGVEPPFEKPANWAKVHDNARSWAADRHRIDGKIGHWAEGLRELDLPGNLTIRPVAGAAASTVSKSLAIIQFFNHQTHQRGKLHAMLTAAGETAPVGDLVHMPDYV